MAEQSIYWEHLGCGEQIEVEFDIEYEPGESNYGADADGNRGISIPGYYHADVEPPEECSHCKVTLTESERKSIEKKIDQYCKDYSEENMTSHDDYYGDQEYERYRDL